MQPTIDQSDVFFIGMRQTLYSIMVHAITKTDAEQQVAPHRNRFLENMGNEAIILALHHSLNIHRRALHESKELKPSHHFTSLDQ